MSGKANPKLKRSNHRPAPRSFKIFRRDGQKLPNGQAEAFVTATKKAKARGQLARALGCRLPDGLICLEVQPIS